MKLDKVLFECAIEHITEVGDTDIFPYPFEIKFLKSEKEKISNALSQKDISQYSPMSLVETLVPKSKYGFRVAHQPFPIDTIVFTSLVLKIADRVESGRDDFGECRAFSYRKTQGLEEPFFEEERTYKNWLDHLTSFLFEENYSHVIRTDISDFYSRIYRHRLENIIESLSGDRKTVKAIESMIADWRTRQSFGIPVGTSASRFLAEAALNDTDLALISEGIDHSRYVDDVIIFVKNTQDPYALLGFLARHLMENEGLSLNNQKTMILTWQEFVQQIGTPEAQDDVSKEQFATEKLFWAAYNHDDYDQDALEALMLKDLCKELEELLQEQYWDMGQIRIILHAMRLVRNSEVAAYIKNNLAKLVPFSKNVCLLIEDFIKAGVGDFRGIEADITQLLLSERMKPLECARAWFMELGVRNLITFNHEQLRQLQVLSGTLDTRQLHLLRWRANDVNFFRARKSRIQEIQAWAQTSFIFGAQCLPKDEYEHWLRSIKSRLNFPLCVEFADWCQKTRGTDILTTNQAVEF